MLLAFPRERNTPRSLLETRSREYLQQGQESLEKKEELDATVAAATAPVPVFETDGSGKVIDEFRAGLAASSTVAQPGELSVDAASCEPAGNFLSSSFSCRHDASLDADGFCQEMSPTTDALDLVYYHGLARNSSSLCQ